MQRLIQISAVLAIIVGVTHEAKAFGVGADLGYSRTIVKDAPDSSGYGGDLYIRPLPLPILDPELQVGLHKFDPNNVSLTLYPLMAGARVYIPTLPLFAQAHVGVIGTHVGISTGTLNTVSNTNWNFGFNVGAGYHFLDLTVLKLGAIVQYWHVSSKNTSDFSMLTAGLDVALGF